MAADTMSTFTRQDWICESCGSTGTVFFHATDSVGRKQTRLEQSHDAKQPHRKADRCHDFHVRLPQQREGTDGR